MRRILFTLMACGALIAVAPATALARHHHQGRHHARQHARHHSRVRFERFGSATPSQPTASGGNNENGNAQPGQENEQNAGTVASFQNGVLTIALNDGSMVSGRVTSDTEMECQASDSSSTMQRDDQGRDGGDQGDNNGEDNNNEDNNDENAGQEDEAQNCSTASLQPGTVVREAELKISSAGATWDKVELASSQTGSNETEGNDS